MINRQYFYTFDAHVKYGHYSGTQSGNGFLNNKSFFAPSIWEILKVIPLQIRRNFLTKIELPEGAPLCYRVNVKNINITHFSRI